jgi:hypothetical protein
MGQYDLSSDLYDTFHFTGASLESDEQMLPPDLRGYAPQISGIAQTNARVTVSQNGRTLYQTSVSPDRLQLPIWGPRCRGNWMSPLKKKMGVKARFRSVQPLSRF